LPNATFVRWAVGPKTVLDGGVAHSDPNPNQVVEVPVWQALNIEVNRSTFDLHSWTAYDVDFSFSDRSGLQRVVISLSLVLQFFWAVPGSEGVRELGDGEDAFAVESGALFFCHISQKTEIVSVDSFLPATRLKLTFSTVPVQNEIRRSGAGK